MAGGSLYQQIVPLAEMSEWLLYDDAEWMRNNYEYGGLGTRWEQERDREPEGENSSGDSDKGGHGPQGAMP